MKKLPEIAASEKVSRNLGKILAIKFLGDFHLVAPILILYYTANGLNSTQIFTVQAVFHLTVLLLEVPSGYLADVVGRKTTMALGAIFFPLGMALYTLGGSFPMFVLAETALAVSLSMRSGCDSALIFDSLRQMDREWEYKRYEGRSALLARTGSAVSSIAGGLLASIFLRLPFLVGIGAALFMPPLALSLTEPERDKRVSAHPFRDIAGICRYCLREAHLRPVILFCGLVMSVNLTGLWAYFLLYRELDIGVGWFGILFCVFQLAGALGGSGAHSFSERFGGKTPLVLRFSARYFSFY